MALSLSATPVLQVLVLQVLILGLLLTRRLNPKCSIPERSQILLGRGDRGRLGLLLITVGLFSATAATAQAQTIRTYPASGVWQENSFDCGPAALATLLQLRLQRSATVSELNAALSEISGQERHRIQTKGYSFNQLVAMTAALGARATLRRLTARGLAQISLPVIVYLDLPSGPHFSVLTGMTGS